MSHLENSRYLTRANDWFRFRDHGTFTGGGGGGGGGAKPMYIGAAQKDYDNFNTEVKNTDGSKAGGTNSGLSARRSYDSSLPASFSQSAASGDPQRGCISVWSWTASSNSQVATDIQAVASGSKNAALTAFFNSIPAGHVMYCIFWHEVDNKYTNYATYKSAFAQIRIAYNASTCDKTKVKMGGLLTSYGFRQGHGPDYFDSNHDFVGIDFYDYSRPAGSPPDPKTGNLGSTHPPSYYCGDAVTLADSLGVPLLVGEYGAHPFNTSTNVVADTDPSSRVYRLQQVVDYLDGLTGGCVTFCYFHSSAGQSGPWWLDCWPNWTTPSDQSSADPDSLAGFRTIVAAHAKYTGS